MKSSDFLENLLFRGLFHAAQVSRCGIDLHGKQCCAAYKKEVEAMGVNLWAGGGGSCGSFLLGRPTFRCELVSFREGETILFLVVVDRFARKKLSVRRFIFLKMLTFYALVGGASFWRGHWIFVKRFFLQHFWT